MAQAMKRAAPYSTLYVHVAQKTWDDPANFACTMSGTVCMLLQSDDGTTEASRQRSFMILQEQLVRA
jgi:hypothetical protein